MTPEPGPEPQPGKGGTPHEATAGETIDAGGDHNYNIQINSAAFNEGDTLTITNFGKDDKLTFDFALTGFTAGGKDPNNANTAVFFAKDTDGHTFTINIQSDLLTNDAIKDIQIIGTDALNTIFDAGTLNTTLVGA